MSRPFDEILQELVQAMDNPVAAAVDKKQEASVAQILSEVEGLPQFLKETMGADMRRYFSAAPEEQRQIKGAFARTAYIYSLTVPKEQNDLTRNSLTGPRKSNGLLKNRK